MPLYNEHAEAMWAAKPPTTHERLVCAIWHQTREMFRQVEAGDFTAAERGARTFAETAEVEGTDEAIKKALRGAASAVRGRIAAAKSGVKPTPPARPEPPAIRTEAEHIAAAMYATLDTVGKVQAADAVKRAALRVAGFGDDEIRDHFPALAMLIARRNPTNWGQI